jgi:hypothetical protein
MTMRWRSRLLILALAMVSVALGAGSAAWGHQEMHHVTLFEDIDFGGETKVLHKDAPNLVEDSFNDLASSLKWDLPKDRAVVLYIDADYKNPLLVLVGKGHLADLGKLRDGNDSISSVAFLHCPGERNPKGVGVDVPRMGER